jgi:hypothetical protein
VNPFLRARRNHAIEHGTVAMLIERQRRRIRVAGLSDPKGFWLVSPASTGDVQHAVSQAITRLQAGERYLAMSELCGTSILATALLTTGAVGLSALRGGGLRRFFHAALVAAIAAPSTGLWAQRTFTVEPDIGDLWIANVRSVATIRGFTLVRVSTSG